MKAGAAADRADKGITPAHLGPLFQNKADLFTAIRRDPNGDVYALYVYRRLPLPHDPPPGFPGESRSVVFVRRLRGWWTPAAPPSHPSRRARRRPIPASS